MRKSVDGCFIKNFVSFLQDLIYQFVPVGCRGFCPVWMRDPPRWLEKSKAEKWKIYIEVLKRHGRNPFLLRH